MTVFGALNSKNSNFQPTKYLNSEHNYTFILTVNIYMTF